LQILKIIQIFTHMKIVVLSGAGISAESGLKTFRDHDGLWEGYNVYEVATPEAWQANPEKVQEFYNMRRKAVLEAEPNRAHYLLKDMEQLADVHIITQNIDNLHERAGSRKVLHLHGEITKARSSARHDLLYAMDGWELKMGQLCELGSQLRPHVVWFGEAVPAMDEAEEITAEADVLVVVGTSLQVYPAAGLVHCVRPGTQVYCVDPAASEYSKQSNVIHIPEKAGTGLQKVYDALRTLI
jgi:NAD-dependent deacetylase